MTRSSSVASTALATPVPTPMPTQAAPLWRSLRAQTAMRCVSVIGMQKNTGKTVCLNHLLAQAKLAHVAVGITSIGRDGEERDAVFSIPKPAVRVTQGCLIATARDTLLRAKTRVKLVGTTGIDSPMGEIVIVKALDDGDMEIAGASRGHDQLHVLDLLKRCGADLVLLDGALGRSHHASPAISDGMVLSTGAAVGGSMQDVLRKTRARLQLLSIPAVPAALHAQVQNTFAKSGVGVWSTHGELLFEQAIPTLNAAQTLQALPQPTPWGTVAVSGAVGRLLWQALKQLLGQHPGLNCVVADGSKLFIDATDLHDYLHRGGQLWAMREIRVLGITLNPFLPLGTPFAAAEFLQAAQQAFPEHVVTDVLLPH